MNNVREALERIAKYPINRNEEISIETAREIARAALASQQDHIPDVGEMVQSQAQQESKPVVWGYAWQCKSMGDWRIEKLGEGCIPPKDTLALYALPPAPEGDKE